MISTLLHRVVGVKEVVLEIGRGKIVGTLRILQSLVSGDVVCGASLCGLSQLLVTYLSGIPIVSGTKKGDSSSTSIVADRSAVELTMVGKMKTATRAAAKLLEIFMVSRRKVG
jgi:hypothetical protein